MRFKDLNLGTGDHKGRPLLYTLYSRGDPCGRPLGTFHYHALYTTHNAADILLSLRYSILVS